MSMCISDILMQYFLIDCIVVNRGGQTQLQYCKILVIVHLAFQGLRQVIAIKLT